MRASFLAVATSAVVVLVTSLAETRTRPALHPDSLARYEAITSSCQKADPAAAPLYAARLAALTEGRHADVIDRDRGSDKYRNAMTQADATLAKASARTMANGCQEFLAEK
jgi:hypothetical protein